MGRKAPSREELFVMVWERPATEVARELGLSDVGLGKLCERLQVPKPPRGYWARVRAGRTPKQPPLEAVRAELAGRPPTRPGVTRLTRKRRQILGEVLGEMAEAGIETEGCVLVHDGFRCIPPELAAQVIVRVQSRYPEWSGQAASPALRAGLQQNAGGLVDTLLPLAGEQVIVLRRLERDRKNADDRLGVVLRLSPDMQRDVVRMHRVVLDTGLAYAARALTRHEHAVSAHYVRPPGESLSATAVLCVSAQDVWVAGDTERWGRAEPFETERLPVGRIVPLDLVAPSDRRLPDRIGRSWLRSYERRLRALRDAEQVVDLVSDLTFRHAGVASETEATLADRLLVGGEGEGPFTLARRRLQQLEAEVEQWEEAIQTEKATFCREVLGIGPGDNVVVEAGGKPVRIAVTDATVHLLDNDILFRISGRRYRKDGLLGKRDDVFTLGVENDTVPKRAGNTPPTGPEPAAGRPAQYPFWLHR